MEPTAEQCTAARIAAVALRRELKKLDGWRKAGAVSQAQRDAVVELLHELERRASPAAAATSTSDEPPRQKRMGFEVPK